MHYFYPQTQPPAGLSLSEVGTPAQSGYLSTNGTALNYVNAAGVSQDLSGGLTTAESDIAAVEGDVATLQTDLDAAEADIVLLQAHKWQVTAPAKNPAAVETLLSGITVDSPGTVTEVRLAVGTLHTGATDAFSFNVNQQGTGNLFATAQVFAREPNVTGFAKSTDEEATFTNYLTEVTGTGTAALAIDTLANGDSFYAGFSDLFAGVRLDMDGANVNAVTATLAAHYWDSNSWEPLTITDGTDSAGVTLAQDGAVTWLVPPDWAQRSLGALGTKHWVRFTVSAAMTAGTAIDNADAIRAVNHFYSFTPDQNAAVVSSAELRLHCTEADANAAGLVLQVVGTYT